MNRIKVLIIDDSPIVRNVLSTNLSKYPDIEIVGTAIDPFNARDKIVQLKPDVITLDLEMPRMNGMEFITVLMEHYPLPIIVFSSLVDGQCELSLQALELGALEVVAKPDLDLSKDLSLTVDSLARKIRSVYGAKIQRHKTDPEVIKKITKLPQVNHGGKIIAIGSSTGGTEVIRYIIENLRPNSPPVIVTQHMPEGFTNAYAKRLDSICKNMEVREAADNDTLHSGLALIAPGDFHLLLAREANHYKVVTRKTPKVNRFRPSVDVMFTSVAEIAADNAVGVILTGMGEDGSLGLLKMKEKGAKTIAQSEKTCAVFGMPDAAIRKGAVDFIEDISNIPLRIMQIL